MVKRLSVKTLKAGQSAISIHHLRQALVEICYFQKDEARFAHLRVKNEELNARNGGAPRSG